MAFQALLFCPDDKTARTVTQVLSELEFSVEPCTEPFAAVKKLMSGHFDALVVDCDNEQNATLLFKSARNSTSNQTSLAVAIVEGQAGVAKAFRIGANLVLTKPINVEQSKGTLRVARGLLRKGEPVKPAAQAPSPSAAATTTTPPRPAAPKPAPPTRPATIPAPAASAPPAAAIPRRSITSPVLQPPESVAAAQAAASSGLAELDEVKAIESTAPVSAAQSRVIPPAAPKASPIISSSAVGGAASAPAPAREAPVPAPESAPSASHKTEALPEKPTESVSSAAYSSIASEAPAPSFSFGGSNEAEETDDGRKKIFIGVAAAILVVVLGYGAIAHFAAKSSQAPVAVPAPSATAPAAATSTPQSAKPAASVPAAQPPAQTAEVNPQPTERAATSAEPDAAAEEPAPVESRAAKSAGTAPAGKAGSSTKPEPAPLVVKGGATPSTKTPAPADTAAPNVVGMAAPAPNGVLSNLVSDVTTPKPVLQTVNISQGVSQGLLVKKVQPVYPKTAMSMRIEGVVELLATISKSGDITSVKILKGDPQLTHAAADAVKQWKYKPYLLNGEPVEITTQVTINFRLPN